PVIGVLSNPVNITQTTMTLNWTAATDDVGVTNYNIYKDGVLELQVGNVLTYDVVGLNPATSYSFYITALDAEGNESENSNTIQATTIQAPTGTTTFTLTTTSSSTNWSPNTIINSGGILTWSAAPSGLYLGETIIADDPVFDFSSNVNNDSIVITITNTDNDFSGLTDFDFWNDNGVGSEITDIDLIQATALTTLNMRYNRLSTLDISQNTELETLTIRGNRQLNYQTLNTSANSKLTTIRIDATGINNVDLSNNDLLTNVFLNNARLPSSVLDQVVMDLDDNGEINGNLFISNNPGYLSTYAREAYLNLVENKGWDIDVVAPPQLNIQVITLTSNSTSNEWKPGIVDNTGDRDPLVWKAYNAVIGTLDPIRIDDGGSLGALPVFDF
ncbi:MAG: fibronectin type III domain-containing protein, partial [Chlamydiia bacterium]|nr:fibronectin type III domain-containing protein [Chlamydiia bacterium]